MPHCCIHVCKVPCTWLYYTHSSSSEMSVMYLQCALEEIANNIYVHAVKLVSGVDIGITEYLQFILILHTCILLWETHTKCKHLITLQPGIFKMEQLIYSKEMRGLKVVMDQWELPHPVTSCACN